MKYENLFMHRKRKKIYEKFSSEKYKLNKKIEVKIVENGIILPAKIDNSKNPKLWAIGGVVDSNDNFVKESTTRHLFGGYYEHNEKYDDYIDEEVVFFGPFVEHWGHFICDQISRLWYIINNPRKYKIAYCGWNWCNGVTDISGNYLELLELLGINKDQLINVQKPTRFKKIIIPDFSFVSSEYYSDDFVKMIDKIVDNVNMKMEKIPRKIYFTRFFLSDNDKENGEINIINYLKEDGYEVLPPEKLSFSEQVYYFNNVQTVCMISGSISHNIMFCKNRNNVVILNKTNMINDYQMIIDHISKAKITYVDVYKKVFHVLFGLGPFLIYVSKYLQKYCKRKIRKYKISYKQYMWYLKKYFKTYKNSYNKMLLKQEKIKVKRINKTGK